MEADNDFFEQLKTQSEQLAANPQPQTWKRLESRLKKLDVEKKTNFLSWSFLNISLLAVIILMTTTVLAYLRYNDAARSERSLHFYTNLQKCEGVWHSKSNSTEERIQLVNTTPTTISIYKSIFFKNVVVNEMNFSIQRNANKNFLMQNGKTFFEKQVQGDKIIFQSGVETVEISNDAKNNHIVFIYPERSTIVYSKDSN